jgi:hypothetical protein
LGLLDSMIANLSGLTVLTLRYAPS